MIFNMSHLYTIKNRVDLKFRWDVILLLILVISLEINGSKAISRPFSFLSTVKVPNDIRDGEPIISQNVEIEGSLWRLIIYPRGDKIAKRLGFCSIYLECLSAENATEACFEISLVGGAHPHKHVSVQKKRCPNHDFGKSFNPYGFIKFIEAKYLFEKEYGCRDEHGNVRFFCEVGKPGTKFRENPFESDTTSVSEEEAAPTNKKKTPTPNGLINQGNTCYLNSLLQILYHIPAFRTLFKGPSEIGQVATALGKVFEGMGEAGPATTKALTDNLGIDTRIQQDAQEFNRLLMNILEESDPTGLVATGIQKLFCGYLSSFISCTEVKYEKRREELFYDISLDVKGCKNIKESLKRFTEPELLSGDNQWKTPDFGKQDALKGHQFLALPQVLQFHLKRFEYDPSSDKMSKIDQHFSFNREIDMRPYMVDESANQLSEEEGTYSLHGIIVHVGSSANVGHYYSYVRPTASGKVWYKLDDQRVTEMKEKKVMEECYGSSKRLFGHKSEASAYILQYFRKNDIENLVSLKLNLQNSVQ